MSESRNSGAKSAHCLCSERNRSCISVKDPGAAFISRIWLFTSNVSVRTFSLACCKLRRYFSSSARCAAVPPPCIAFSRPFICVLAVLAASSANRNFDTFSCNARDIASICRAAAISACVLAFISPVSFANAAVTASYSPFSLPYDALSCSASLAF